MNLPDVTGRSLDDALRKLNWTIRGLSNFLGTGERTVWRWQEAGQAPRAVMMLLWLMIDRKIGPATALKAVGLSETEAREVTTNLHAPEGKPGRPKGS